MRSYRCFASKNIKTLISQLILKIDLWFPFLKIHWINDSLKTLSPVCRLGYKRHKCKNFINVVEGFMIFFVDLCFSFSFCFWFSSLFLKITKNFATYDCCHPCFLLPLSHELIFTILTLSFKRLDSCLVRFWV